MSDGEDISDLPGKLQCSDCGQPLTSLPEVAQPAGEALAAQVLHDEVGSPVGGVPKVGDLDDAGMLRLAQNLGLVEEAGDGVLVASIVRDRVLRATRRRSGSCLAS